MNNSLEKASYRGVRALVTGASGFIGRWVAKLLSEDECDLWVVAKDERRLNDVLKTYSIKARPVISDLSKPKAFYNLFRKIQPDITFNLTGYGVSQRQNNEKMAWQINAELVEKMGLTIAKESRSKWDGLKLIHVGSGFEYGSIPNKISEETEPKPKTIYGRSKLAGTRRLQEICSKNGLRAVTARLFSIYGPGENPERLLPSLLRGAEMEEFIKLTKGEQKRDFTYVKDVAIGLLKLGLLSDVPGNILNLATGKMTSVKDFAECARSILGIDYNRLLLNAIPYREDEIWKFDVDVSFLRNLTGWLPSYSIYEGIKETIEFEKLKIKARGL